MSLLPELMRKAEQHGQVAGKESALPTLGEKPPMQEVVRDRIGIPPQQESDEDGGRPDEDGDTVKKRQGAEQRSVDEGSVLCFERKLGGRSQGFHRDSDRRLGGGVSVDAGGLYSLAGKKGAAVGKGGEVAGKNKDWERPFLGRV